MILHKGMPHLNSGFWKMQIECQTCKNCILFIPKIVYIDVTEWSQCNGNVTDISHDEAITTIRRLLN